MNKSIQLTNKDTFALYRLPNQLNHYLVKQKDNSYSFLDTNTFNEKGFVFYPFTRSSGKPSVFIKGEEVLSNAIINFRSTHTNPIVSISKSTYIDKVNQFIGAT